MLKYNITALFQQFTEILNQHFHLFTANKNLQTCLPVSFQQLKE